MVVTMFRPCIDLHQGKVKQIIGGSLNDKGAATNYVSPYDATYYAELYRQHNLTGGHVISLGSGNIEQAYKALSAWQGGLQYGGGVTPENAADFIEAGASHVIVTSFLFVEGKFDWSKLAEITAEVGAERLIIDLSCRRTASGWNIATNRWQTVTSTEINPDILQALAGHCSELLVHAADMEGLQSGIDQELVGMLAEHCPLPVTYAGGAGSLADLHLVRQLSGGKVDLTIGSALDIFGGTGVSLEDCIDWNNKQQSN